MVTVDRRCSACNGEMFLDHVRTQGKETILYYSCMNPSCREHGKAYSLLGEEEQSQIKPKEQAI